MPYRKPEAYMTVTHIHAPHATFGTGADLEEFADVAVATERAIREYMKDGSQLGLYEDLRALGWPDAEIANVVKDTHAALECGYGDATTGKQT
jgi:hypothetical protein